MAGLTAHLARADFDDAIVGSTDAGGFEVEEDEGLLQHERGGAHLRLL